MPFDRYGSDVLNTDWRAPKRGRAVEIEADKGLVVEEVCGTGAMSPDEATERLYGLPAGIELPAAGTRIPDRFLETHPVELLAAMAAPSYLPTGVTWIDDYAAAEAQAERPPSWQWALGSPRK